MNLPPQSRFQDDLETSSLLERPNDNVLWYTAPVSSLWKYFSDIWFKETTASAFEMAESLLARICRPRVSGSSTTVSILLVLCSCITSTVSLPPES